MRTTRILALGLVLAGALLMGMSVPFPAPVYAVECSVSPVCGCTVSADTTLASDIGPCSSGVGVGIVASDVTLDCSGHSIIGEGAASGVFVTDGEDNITVSNCNISGFALNGVYVADSLECSTNVTLFGNTITGNAYGIHLGGGACQDNLFYDNYLDNTEKNAIDFGTNTWNIAKTPGTNIIGGPYLGGNYWSDYAGVDTDGDGLGDTDLPCDSGGNIHNGGDYAPLVPVGGPVGGVADLPDVSGSSGQNPVAIAGLAAAAVVALVAGARYARRRWLG